MCICLKYLGAPVLGAHTFMIWRRIWQLSPVFLPVESHGQRSLVGYSPWGRKESDTTEQLSSYARTGQITTMASKVQVTLIFCD